MSRASRHRILAAMLSACLLSLLGGCTPLTVLAVLGGCKDGALRTDRREASREASRPARCVTA